MDNPLDMKDLKARMLIGTKQEMEELLKDIEIQKISQLEKKIFRTLLLFKLEYYKESNESMNELIKDIGNLDLPYQAKMHMFRAEILDKLSLQQDAIKALRKAIRIFRDLSNENDPYFGEHHFYLQIGDQFRKYNIYQDALESYSYIFEAKEKYFVYPNDWAIRIVSYFKYFEITQLVFKEKVKKSILDSCQQEIDKQDRKEVDQFKLDYYLGVNYLLDDKIDNALQCFEASESNYLKKNQMKRNNKLIDYVNKFITIKEPFTKEDKLIPDFDPDVYAIKFVPEFLKMQKEYYEVVNKRLKQLNQKEKQRNEWIAKITELEKQFNNFPQEQNGELQEQGEAKKQQMEKELALEKENFKLEFNVDNFEVYKYFKKFKYQPSSEILQSMSRNLEIIKKVDKIQNQDMAQNIYLNCCFEFIQIERYDYASFFLEEVKDKGFAVVFILILFLSQKIKKGLKILKSFSSQILNINIQLEQGLIEQKQEFYLGVLNLMADCLQQTEDFDEDTQKLNNELYEFLVEFAKEDYYKNLFIEIENCRFYDPYVYEFKDKLFTYLFKRKKENLQAIFTNGQTYVAILKETKASWIVNKDIDEKLKQSKTKKL